MSENNLTSQIAIAASKASAAVNDEVRAALEGLKKNAPQYVIRAAEIQAKVAIYLAQGASGDIPLDMAQEAASREMEAFKLLAEKAREEGAQAALKRFNKGVAIATEFGVALIKIAAQAAIPGA